MAAAFPVCLLTTPKTRDLVQP